MALISTFGLTDAGTAPAYGAAASGDTAKCGPGLFLHVKNGGGSSITVTLAVPGKQVSGIDNDPQPVTVGAGVDGWIPLRGYYANATDGTAHITWSSTTTVTRAVVRVP